MPSEFTRKQCPACEAVGLIETYDSGGDVIGFTCRACGRKLLVLAAYNEQRTVVV